MKQGTEKRPAAERARAARRAAQLRREAEERVEAQAKLDEGGPLTINDCLAMLGSAFRVPEEVNPWEGVKQGWVDNEIEAVHVDELLAFLNEHYPKEPEPEPTPKRRKRGEAYTFTAEDITQLRDVQGLAWRQVAVNLGLDSTFAARRAYRTLTGKAPSESKPENVRRVRSNGIGTVKGSTRKVHAVQWDDETDQDHIIELLGNGARILIQREVKGVRQEEDLTIGRLVKLTWDGKDESGPLVAHFTDRETGGMRSVRIADIKEVR